MLGRFLRALINLDLSPITVIILLVIALVAVAIIILPPIIALLVHFIISFQISSASKKKGHSFILTFIMCFLLGMPGYFYAVALPDVAKQKQLEKIINLLQIEKEFAVPQNQASGKKANGSDETVVASNIAGAEATEDVAEALGADPANSAAAVQTESSPCINLEPQRCAGCDKLITSKYCPHCGTYNSRK